MTGDPLVSVIIPAYNAATQLSGAIASLQAQTYANWEAIVVDDHSADSTLALAQELAAQDARVRVLSNTHGKGVSGARNTGLDAFRGEFVCFLDADDALDAEAIAARVAGYQSTPDEKVAWFVLIEMVDEAGVKLGRTIGNAEEFGIRDYWGNPVHIMSPLLRRGHVTGLQFPEEFGNGEDWIFMARLAARGVIFRRTAQGRGFYTIHPGSATKSDLVKHALKLSEAAELIFRELDLERLGKEPGKPIPTLPFVTSQLRLQACISALVRGDATDGLLRQEDIALFSNGILRENSILDFSYELGRKLEWEYSRHNIMEIGAARRSIRKDKHLRQRVKDLRDAKLVRTGFLLSLSPAGKLLRPVIRLREKGFWMFRYLRLHWRNALG